mgnify:CR=1 FL=1
MAAEYRLIDVPVSGCLHADIRRIFVLTQFNSASLNRHISNTYRLDRFSGGFVEILAAEQTPDNPNWYQGTADAVRAGGARTSAQHRRRDYDLILAGDHLCRMDYADLDRRAPHGSGADITIAAQPVDRRDGDADGDLPLRRRRPASSPSREAERRAARADRPQHSRRLDVRRVTPTDQPFMASMGVYVFTRRVLPACSTLRSRVTTSAAS